MTDVEMKAEDKKTEEKKEEEKKEEVPPTPEQEIKSNIVLIERAVSTLEPRFTHRVLRTLATLRKKINETVLKNAIEDAYPKGELYCANYMTTRH